MKRMNLKTAQAKYPKAIKELLKVGPNEEPLTTDYDADGYFVVVKKKLLWVPVAIDLGGYGVEWVPSENNWDFWREDYFNDD